MTKPQWTRVIIGTVVAAAVIGSLVWYKKYRQDQMAAKSKPAPAPAAPAPATT